MKFRWMLLSAVLLLLSGCGAKAAGAPQEEPAPPPHASAAPAPQAADPIAARSVATAEEWNAFAADFNRCRENYADDITVTVCAALDFSDMDFVPLYSGFSGTICGPAPLEHGSAAAEQWFPADGTALPAAGFCNIRSISAVTGPPVKVYGESVPTDVTGAAQGEDREAAFLEFREADGERTAPDSLFGLVSRQLVIRDLCFQNISSEKLTALFSHSCGALRVCGVSIRQCRLPYRGTALLAANAGSAAVEDLTVSSCGISADCFGAGLVRWVGGDAAFRNVALNHFDLELAPDLGGSGYSLSGTGVLAQNIFGGARFESISLYGCKFLTGSTSVLCRAVGGDIAECRDISVERCSLLAYQRGISVFPPEGLLFQSSTQTPVLEENISFRDSLLNAFVYSEADGEYRNDPETFAARGYRFENCVFPDLSDAP